MDEWNYDMSKAPTNGRAVFGCSTGDVAVMYFDKEKDDFVRSVDKAPFRAVGWLEIPPVNIAL